MAGVQYAATADGSGGGGGGGDNETYDEFDELAALRKHLLEQGWSLKEQIGKGTNSNVYRCVATTTAAAARAMAAVAASSSSGQNLGGAPAIHAASSSLVPQRQQQHQSPRPQQLAQVEVAVKVVDIRGLRLHPDYQYKKERIWQEINIMRGVSHPNIISLIDTFEVDNKVGWLVGRSVGWLIWGALTLSVSAYNGHCLSLIHI